METGGGGARFIAHFAFVVVACREIFREIWRANGHTLTHRQSASVCVCVHDRVPYGILAPKQLKTADTIRGNIVVVVSNAHSENRVDYFADAVTRKTVPFNG